MIRIKSYLEFLEDRRSEGGECSYGDKACQPNETSRICLDCYDDYVERNLPKPRTKVWINSKWRLGKTCSDE